MLKHMTAVLSGQDAGLHARLSGLRGLRSGRQATQRLAQHRHRRCGARKPANAQPRGAR